MGETITIHTPLYKSNGDIKHIDVELPNIEPFDTTWGGGPYTITPLFAVIYRDAPIKGLRTFPHRKKRLHKKEQVKREKNLVDICEFEP